MIGPWSPDAILGTGSIVATFLLAWVLALVVRRNAQRLGLVQVPNERSSHVRATPTGGGVGIAAAALAGGGLFAPRAPSDIWVMLVLSGAAAALGLLDDRYDLSSRLRFAVQCGMALVLVVYFGARLTEALPIAPAVSIPVLAIVAIGFVWWINLFNFMDGIDGLAASQSIFILVSACGLAIWRSTDLGAHPVWLWGLAIAAAASGFLMVNWPPAKIFMGDAGSNFLAAAIGVFACYSIAEGWLSYSVWAILVAAFASDATITLLTRMLRGERWSSAHRSHAYQRLARRFGSHKSATLLYLGINLAWLLPIAAFAHTAPAYAPLLVVLAYLPLVIGMTAVGAGRS